MATVPVQLKCTIFGGFPHFLFCFLVSVDALGQQGDLTSYFDNFDSKRPHDRDQWGGGL